MMKSRFACVAKKLNFQCSIDVIIVDDVDVWFANHVHNIRPSLKIVSHEHVMIVIIIFNRIQRQFKHLDKSKHRKRKNSKTFDRTMFCFFWFSSIDSIVCFLFFSTTKSITSFKRQSISQLYLDKNPGSDIKNSDLLFGTSLVNDTPQILEEDSFLYSASYSTASPLLKSKKSVLDSPQKQDSVETPTLPIVADEVQYQLTGTGSDDTIRNDFHYDQSPSITLCLSLIELHSNQYEGGKLLIKLCEYLSEQLSTRQRNTEIDYGLVLNIIKNLLFTAKMKLMAVVVSDDDEIVEQQKLIASCDLYNNLVDILSRLNMANCSLPALNDLLQQDTLRKIRNQLLDDERYQLAMDISTRCNLDTQSIWFQWGMGRFFI